MQTPAHRRAALLVSATLLSTALLSLEWPVLRNVETTLGENHVSVGAVRTSLWQAAFAQAPESFVLENISFSFGPATYQAKRVEFSGLTSSRSEVEAVFDKNATEPLAERIRRIKVAEVRIPELVSESKAGPISQRTVANDIVLRDVSDGIVREIRTGRTVEETSEPDGKTLTSYATGLVETLNAAELAKLVFEKGGSSAPKVKLYNNFTIEGISTERGSLRMTARRMSGRDISARATQVPWSELQMVILQAAKDDATPAETAGLITTLADMASSVDVGLLELADIKFESTADNGKIAIGRIAGTSGSQTAPADMRLENLQITAGSDTSIKLDLLAFTGFSFQPTLETLRTINAQTINDPEPETLRKLIPTLGTIRLSGFDANVPDTRNRMADGRSRMKVQDFEATAVKPINGIPTNLHIALRDLFVPLPSDDNSEALRALGYESLNLSATAAARWDEAAQELVIDEVSMRLQDMGSALVRGVVGNIERDVFDPDTDTALGALFSGKVKAVEIKIEDEGILDRHIRQESGDRKKRPETLRREYATAASAMVREMLGNNQQARAAGQAISSYIAKPGVLTLSLKAKESDGLGIVDILGITDPKKALRQIDVSAKAEARP